MLAFLRRFLCLPPVPVRPVLIDPDFAAWVVVARDRAYPDYGQLLRFRGQCVTLGSVLDSRAETAVAH